MEKCASLVSAIVAPLNYRTIIDRLINDRAEGAAGQGEEGWYLPDSTRLGRDATRGILGRRCVVPDSQSKPGQEWHHLPDSQRAAEFIYNCTTLPNDQSLSIDHPWKMDKLLALKMFVETVDAKGFSAAARRLELATSSVTRALDGLETSLGRCC